MARRSDETTRLLGPLGADVMDLLWSATQPMSVRAVLDQLNRGPRQPLAYTTVMTVLSRLTERGAARRTRAGRGYVYEAAVRDAAELAVRDVLRNHGAAAVAHFVDQAQADARLRKRLERLVSGQPGTARSDHRSGGSGGG